MDNIPVKKIKGICTFCDVLIFVLSYNEDVESQDTISSPNTLHTLKSDIK